MSQSIQVAMSRDRRTYREVPKGVSRWTAINGAATGAATGVITFQLPFNPGSDQGFQPYVSLSRVAIASATAALVILGVHVRMANGEWEDGLASSSVPVTSFSMINEEDAPSFIGGSDQSVLLGRVTKGTPGNLEVFVQEINTTVYTLSMAGFISDKPFLAPNFWRA